MKKWFEVENIGQLYEEIVLVYGNEPVLFVCLDDRNQRYLCMSYDSFSFNYVIAHITTDHLIEMLENKITMSQAFRSEKKIYFTEENEEDDSCLHLTAYESNAFPADHLPDSGEYYELDFKWVRDYIQKLKEERSGEIELNISYELPVLKKSTEYLNIRYQLNRSSDCSIVFENPGYVKLNYTGIKAKNQDFQINKLSELNETAV